MRRVLSVDVLQLYLDAGATPGLRREHQKYIRLQEIKHALMIYLIFIKSAALVPRD